MSRLAHTDLAALTNMLYQVEQSKMQSVIEQEAALRRDLAQLEARRIANQALHDVQLRVVRQIGADVQWQAWLGRTRADLNRQLALCLVQKERMLKAIRRTHSRKLAADQLVSVEHETRARRRHKNAQIKDQSLSMIKEIQGVQTLE